MKTVDLNFTKLEIHDCYSIVRTCEGVDVNLADHERMREAVEREIDGPYGLIFDWVNSYSVNPEVIEAIRINPRIACYAVVVYRDSTATSLASAAEAIGKPGTFCSNLNEAQQWVRETLGRL
ncbi:MAG: hypothetical protein V3R65_06925 [Acidiferrobacterales bacterium]